MRALFFFLNTIIFFSFFLTILSGCRKKIDFELVGTETITLEQTDPNQLVFWPWEQVSQVSGVSNLESDGNLVYYNRYVNGLNTMYSLDTNGVSTPLFDVSNNDNVSLITFSSSKLYYSLNNSSNFFLNEFDQSGILESYQLNVLPSSGSEVNVVLDLGSELFVAGDYTFQSGTNPAGFVCKLDKVTGDSIPMLGINRKVYDAITYNNEIYIVGSRFSTMSGSIGWSLAKWSGNQWDFLAINSGMSQASITSIGSSNNEIFLGGYFHSIQSGVCEFDQSSGYFLYNQMFEPDHNSLSTASVKIKEYDGKLYFGGTITYDDTTIKSIYELDNGMWRCIGDLGLTISDLAVCNGYVYAAAEGRLYMHKL